MVHEDILVLIEVVWWGEGARCACCARCAAPAGSRGRPAAPARTRRLALPAPTPLPPCVPLPRMPCWGTCPEGRLSWWAVPAARARPRQERTRRCRHRRRQLTISEANFLCMGLLSTVHTLLLMGA